MPIRKGRERKRHPLVALLRTIRQHHTEVSMADIEICMDIPHGTLHQIEGEYHLLPHFQRGLGKWLRDFLRCVKATPEEVEAVRHLASRVILMEFGDDLD